MIAFQSPPEINAMHGAESGEQTRLGTMPSVFLDTLPVHRAARVIRRLGSSLVSIGYRQDDNLQMLVYTFDVAGKVQPFHVPVTDEPIESIVDLYPNASIYEQELHQTGLRFQPPRRD